MMSLLQATAVNEFFSAFTRLDELHHVDGCKFLVVEKRTMGDSQGQWVPSYIFLMSGE